MAKGKITALEAMQRELELAVLERDVELANVAGDPTARRVIEARKPFARSLSPGRGLAPPVLPPESMVSRAGRPGAPSSFP
jgi:hypothetical protein